jgi:hypothetical protein
MGRLRRRATIARKAITQILETVEEYAIEGSPDDLSKIAR